MNVRNFIKKQKNQDKLLVNYNVVFVLTAILSH